MTTRKMYDADVSASLISRVTDDVYPIVYLDHIVVKIRQAKRAYRTLEPRCEAQTSQQ